MARRSMMELVRKGKEQVRGSGFIATWDVDSRDRAAANRLSMFLFGRTVRKNGKEYRYLGFVRVEGVRYLAQSAIFVLPHRLSTLVSALSRLGIDHEVDRAIYP